MDTKIEEIQQNIFRICLRPKGSFISFNHFLIKDEKPTLIHTGHRELFQYVYEEVNKIINAENLSYITFSHFEPDECGSLNEWLEIALNAQVAINKICDWSVKDFIGKPSLVLKDGEILDLGKHKLKMIETPHFPHAWEASVFYDTTSGVLFGSDIGTQQGFKDSLDNRDVVEEIFALQQKLGYMPFGPSMAEGIRRLQDINISILATMHGTALNQKNCRNLLALLEAENQKACRSIFQDNYPLVQ